MATISVVFNNSANSPGVTITTSGLTGYDTYSIIRVDNGSIFDDAPVRGADNVDVISDNPTLTDYECPINIEVYYRLELYTAGVLSDSEDSSPITIESADPIFEVGYNNFWVKNVFDPTQSLALIVGDFSEIAFEPKILGEYKVLGRRNPVVFTDVWGAREGDFPVYSMDYVGTQTDITALETLLTSGDVLLFQSAIQPRIIRDMYFVVTSLNRSQGESLSNSYLPTFTYNVGFQEVDSPEAEGQAFAVATIGDLTDDPSATVATWADVVANFASWSDVINNYAE